MKSNNFRGLVLNVLVLLMISAMFFSFSARADLEIGLRNDEAVITRLIGPVFRINEDLLITEDLIKGVRLHPGDRIRTDTGGRIELTFPDQSLIRLDEHTMLEITMISVDQEFSRRNIGIRLLIGKTWANVKSIPNGTGTLSIASRTTVADSRGAVFRMDVLENDVVIVKTYEDTVRLEFSPPPNAPDSKTTAGTPGNPIFRQGNHEKRNQILQSGNMLIARSAGVVTRPFRFPLKVDICEWVLWNQEHDRIEK